MSRARKPVDSLTGHQTQRDIEEKKYAESLLNNLSKDGLKTPPDWLFDDIAKAEWLRVVPLLDELKIIGDTDLNNLGVYCNTYSQYRKITNALKKTPITSKGKINDSFERLSSQQRYFAELLRKFAGTLGLTIDSRLKAAAIKVKEEDDVISGEFGDI